MAKISSAKETQLKGHVKAVDSLLEALSRTTKRLKKEGLKKSDAFRAAARLLEVEHELFGRGEGDGH